MIRKESAGDYQIGIYAVQREGRKWVATTDRLGFRKEFPTLAAAYLELTGEPMHQPRQYRVLWEIDIEASSPREAAEKALAIHRKPDSIATVFDVREAKQEDGRTVYGNACTIDLTPEAA